MLAAMNTSLDKLLKLYTQLQNALVSNNTFWFAVPNFIVHTFNVHLYRPCIIVPVSASENREIKSKHWLGMLMDVF